MKDTLRNHGCGLAAGGLVLLLAVVGTRAQENPSTPRHLAAAPVAASPPHTAKRPALPPAPAGVADLEFREFFRQPVGPLGLELTDKLRSLDQKRVRLVGFLVRGMDPEHGQVLLTSVPVTLHEHEYGPADELPSATVHVLTSSAASLQKAFTPAPVVVIGTLSVGGREEADGRVSLVRLKLDSLDVLRTAPAAPAPAEKQP